MCVNIFIYIYIYTYMRSNIYIHTYICEQYMNLDTEPRTLVAVSASEATEGVDGE
jgi:hypothetical protein